MKEYKLYIDGKYVSSSAGTIVDSINPADGSVFAKVHMASKENIELAIASAYRAQKLWAKTTPREKEAVLLRAAEIFEKRADDIRDILMRESGSTIAKCNFEISGQTFTLIAERREDGEQPFGKGTNYWVDFSWDNEQINFADILEAVGELPIPPYLNRKTEENDKISYQTIYSKIKGSVAAPTAGLHFTNKVLQAIKQRDIVEEEVTLHVGAGTFKPVKSESINGHEMHTEYIVVHRHTLENLLRFHCVAIAVGTTSVRTLESLYYMGVKLASNPEATEEMLHVTQWEPYEAERNGMFVNGISAEQAIYNVLDWLKRNGLEALHSSTQIIIAPGYQYKIVKMLITNFHQPQSTLLLLVSAFVHGEWRKIYDYALAHNFRFLSYGDSSLLIP